MSLTEQRDSLLDQMQPLTQSLSSRLDERSFNLGSVAAINRQLARLNQANLAAIIASEKAALRQRIRSARSDLRRAVRSLVSTPFPSSEYDNAEANVRTIRQMLVALEGELAVLGQTARQNQAEERARLEAQRNSLNEAIASLNQAIATINASLAPLRTQLTSVLAQLGAIQGMDNLQPFVVAPICSRLSS